MSNLAGPVGKLYLVGLRGTGKTSVGRIVAERLGLPFVDADVELEKRAGRSIRDIFANDGESVFRDFEERIIAELSTGGPAVVATGGGVVLREANRARMRATGRVVWLTADADTLWQRISADTQTAARRPDLSTGGRAEIEESLRRREPLYQACADSTVAVAGRSPSEIAADILAACSISFSTRP